jgi:small conductance mechanosensitive channel
MPANQSIRTEIAGIIAVIAFAAAALFIASYLIGNHYIPHEFLQPLFAAIILISGYAWVRIITAVIEKVIEPTIGVTKAHGIKNIFYIVAAIIIVVILSTVFNFNLTGVLVGAGFAGIVLGLAAQQVLGNIFGGLSLLASRPFEIGDRITLVTATYSLLGLSYPHESLLNGFTGVVTDITIFFTKMDLDNGTPAIIPNSVVVGSMAVNHSRISSRIVRVRMDLDKKVDYETFKQKFLDAIKKFDAIEADRSTMETIDIGSTTYQVVLVVWTKSSFEEPIKTIVIQSALKIQAELTPPPKTA